MKFIRKDGKPVKVYETFHCFFVLSTAGYPAGFRFSDDQTAIDIDESGEYLYDEKVFSILDHIGYKPKSLEE